MLLSEKCGKFAQNNHFRIPMHTSATEKTTDTIVYNLMREAQLNPQPEKSSIIEVEEALRTASKRLTGRAGYPEWICQSGDFLIIVEDKKNSKYQANYMPEKKNDVLLVDRESVTDYAENGALHYAQNVASKTGFKKNLCFRLFGDR